MGDAGEIRRKAALDARRKVELREQAALQRRTKKPLSEESELPPRPADDDRGGGEVGGEKAAFGWKGQEAVKRREEDSGKGDDDEDDFPTPEECEAGVRRMISGSIYGMREGLELLGLPSDPLFYVRGKRLLLLGRDIRSLVNAIIDEWMMENTEEFRRKLRELREEIWALEARQRMDEQFQLSEDGQRFEDESDAGSEFSVGSGLSVSYQEAAAAKAEKEAEERKAKGQAQSEKLLQDIDSQEHAEAAVEEAAGAVPSSEASDERQSRPKRQQPTVAWDLPEFGYDLYEVLDLDPDADIPQVRARYRTLVMTEHPSKGGDEENFARMTEAYEVLTNYGKRQAYDARRRTQRGV